MPVSPRLQWRDGVSVSETADGLFVEGRTARVGVNPESTAIREALRRLAPPGEDEDRLADLTGDGDGGLARWYYHLGRLLRRGLVCFRAYADGDCLATLLPTSSRFVPGPLRPVAETRYILSRFAYLRRDGAEMLLESPLAHARIICDDPRAAALTGSLGKPATVDELAARTGGLDADAATAVLALLIRAGLVNPVRGDGTTGDDDDPTLQTWAFHDLLFHARSRRGRSDLPYGGTYRFAGRGALPPAVKETPAVESRELFRPDLARLMRDDPPLAQVQERRRSVRAFDREQPITDKQLGEFLFRTARVRERRQVEIATPTGPLLLELAARPYPSGGSLYELEVYLAVQHCYGLAAALYHYDPEQHRLDRLKAREADLAALLTDAADAVGAESSELQVLVVLAARFERLAWKYESIAYSLILKHVGVLMQTMYLAATAMGLGCCAVGGGDSDLFAQAAGTRYAAETSVGELLLGSCAASSPGNDRSW